MFRARSFAQDAPQTFPGVTRVKTPPSPPCKQCASAETEPVATMTRHTSDASQWFHCDGCGCYFTKLDDE